MHLSSAAGRLLQRWSQCTVVCDERMERQHTQAKMGEFPAECGEQLGMVKLWNKLPREVVMT